MQKIVGMKRTNLSKVLMAWMLLITFTTVLAIKDLHFHDYKDVHVEKLSAKGNAQVAHLALSATSRCTKPVL